MSLDQNVEQNPQPSDETKDTEFFSVFDGTKGRPESIYLDMQERQQAERSRAIAEGREPETDLSKLPAAVGTPLVVEVNRVDNSVYSNPPMHYLVEPKDVDPVSTLPVSTGTDPLATGSSAAVDDEAPVNERSEIDDPETDYPDVNQSSLFD